MSNERLQSRANARWVFSSAFITNIGDGMHTIALGKLLYDATGSAGAFGVIIIIEYAINSLALLVAGSVVDRGSPLRTMVNADVVRGVAVCGVVPMLGTDSMQLWLVLSILVINGAKPFYRSATFALGPSIVEHELLMGYNARLGASIQIGQILGAACVGVLLQYADVSMVFVCNGLSYVLAALCLTRVTVLRSESKSSTAEGSVIARVLADWAEIKRFIMRERGVGAHIVLSTVDFQVVALLNICLVPLIYQRYDHNMLWLSAFDGAFALGAVVTSVLITRVKDWARPEQIVIACTALSGMSFIGLSLASDPMLGVGLIFLLGMANGMAAITMLTRLQLRAQGPIRGRVSVVRHGCVSVIALVLLPWVTSVQDASLADSLLLSGVICGMFSLLAFVCSRKVLYGARFFGASEVA